jgi:hypothetical protein
MWRPTFEKEDSDDRFAEKLNASVDAMANRRVLLRYVLVLGAVNLFIWLSNRHEQNQTSAQPNSR